MSSIEPSPKSKPASAPAFDWVELVREKAGLLKYGSLHITIHDGRITQIDVLEKHRLQDTGGGNAGASCTA